MLLAEESFTKSIENNFKFWGLSSEDKIEKARDFFAFLF